MKTLDEIAIEHGTDKATKHPITPHGYCPHYERCFSAMRDDPIKLLEIGVGGGESIRTWLEFFPNAKVFGVDLTKETNQWNTANPKESDPRYVFAQGDQSDETFWKGFIADHGKDWDIIIDDGGHFSNQIIISFNSLWPAVRARGFYCIEDLGVCYGQGSIFIPEGWPKHMEFIKTKLDEINLKDEMEWMGFSKELAIIRKKQ